MMKTSGIVSFAAGTLLLVPTTQKGRVDTLQQALGRTVQALEQFAGYETRLMDEQTAGLDPELLERVLQGTEAAILDTPGREQRIFSLRDEINRLQIAYDTMLGGDERPELRSAVLAPLVNAAHETSRSRASESFSGIDANMRELLRRIQPKKPADSATLPETQDATGANGTSVAPEAPGYSADPVRQARACYKAGLYERGVAVLDGIDDDLHATYWRARLFEMLERPTDAIAAYREVVNGDEGQLAERARGDLDFLEWRQTFRREQIREEAQAK